MLDVIVLGATFAAAGIAQTYKKNCLVIEESTRAGYEFFGALHFGSGYEKPAKTPQSEALQKLLTGQENLYGGDRHIYPLFDPEQLRFGTKLVSVTREAGFVRCVTHGVSGFVTYEARHFVDTTVESNTEKTYNFLMESPTAPTFPGVTYQKGGMENHYIVRCPVAPSCSYTQARQQVLQLVRQFSDSQRLILCADVFDYRVSPQPESSSYLPSKAYENPVRAFEAGLLWKGGSAQ